MGNTHKPVIDTDNPLWGKALKRIDLIYTSLRDSFDDAFDLSLYSGRMGVLLFYYYYSLFRDKQDDFWIEFLQKLNESLYNFKYSNDYYRLCCSNFYLFILLLWENGDITEDELENMNDFDDGVVQYMMEAIQRDFYDLLYGGLNYANYFLYRYKLNGDEKYLDKFLYIIYDKAEKTNDGLCWKSGLKKDLNNEIVGYNLGLAHGIPSILQILCYIKRAGYPSNLLDYMIAETSKFILSQEQDFSKYHSHFSGANIDVNTMSRLGWCYGDLGIGYALLTASQELNDIDLKIKSLNILKDTTSRITEEFTLILDHCICHGTAGVGHIYNRLYQITEDDLYKKSSLYWFKNTIEAPVLPNYPAGYMEYKGNNIYDKGYGLLSGISGIGLAMISAISSVEPKWDRVLLLS